MSYIVGSYKVQHTATFGDEKTLMLHVQEMLDAENRGFHAWAAVTKIFSSEVLQRVSLCRTDWNRRCSKNWNRKLHYSKRQAITAKITEPFYTYPPLGRLTLGETERRSRVYLWKTTETN